MFCNRCGNAVNEWNTVCGKCGMVLGKPKRKRKYKGSVILGSVLLAIALIVLAFLIYVKWMNPSLKWHMSAETAHHIILKQAEVASHASENPEEYQYVASLKVGNRILSDTKVVLQFDENGLYMIKMDFAENKKTVVSGLQAEFGALDEFRDTIEEIKWENEDMVAIYDVTQNAMIIYNPKATNEAVLQLESN